MLSLIVTRDEAVMWKSLCFTDEELNLLADVLAQAAVYLHQRKDEALGFVRERRPDITSEALWRMATS